jgi:HEAT repeat protein
MYANKILVNTALICWMCLCGLAQDASELTDCPSSNQRCGDRGCIPKVKLLQCHNIELTPGPLIVALQDPNPLIRDAAAETLASQATNANKEEAVSALTAALKSEKQVRFEMAYALVHLGAEEGFSELHSMCDDNGLGAFQRMNAASALVQAGDEHCIQAVFSVVQSGENDVRAYALSILPKYRDGPPGQAEMVFDMLTESLSDKTPSIKAAASSALALLGKAEAIPHLERAIASERDKQMKLQLEDDLRRLRRQHL